MLTTTRVLSLLLVMVVAGWAQTVDTIALRASLSPANEVPPVTGVTALGAATILVHITHTAGNISSGVVEFEVDYNVAGPAEFVGLQIHDGPAGANAGIVIPTNLSAASPVAHTGGVGLIRRQVPVADAALLTRLLARPDQFYVNLLSAANPAGLMRGQSARAEFRFQWAHLSPFNEVPAILDTDASGSANIIALAVRGSSGEIVSGAVRFDVNYRFATSDGTASGLHIHSGPVGVNAGVVIQPSPGVAAAEGIAANGLGNITRTSADITAGAALAALQGLFVNPAGYYANLHTVPAHGGGVIRGQVQDTGAVVLRMGLSTQNEVPAVTGLEASGPATVSAFVTRDEAGQVTAGAVIFDVNYRFPAGTEFTGLHIHRGGPTEGGDVVISSGLSREVSPTGVGNFFRVVNIDRSNPAALAALNGLLANPERYYVNLHTTTHPNGAIRSQVSPAAAGPPAINTGGIISATNDVQIAPASPGSIATLYGLNLIRTLPFALGLDQPILPVTLNGLEVRVGTRQAPIFYADFNQINFQVPYETPEGDATVFVVRSGEFSGPYTLRVTRFSPGIFPGAVVRNSDFSVIGPGNAAAANDVILFFGTGLGGVTPPVRSGQLAPAGPISLTTTQPTVTIGGQNADVLGSALTPNFAGLYQVAVRVPPGLAAGPQPAIISIGGLRSNSVSVLMR